MELLHQRNHAVRVDGCNGQRDGRRDHGAAHQQRQRPRRPRPDAADAQLQHQFQLGVRISGLAGYAPTGDYEVGRLANTGKNFWTIEPTLGLMYFGQKNGIEASVFFGADFNTENPDTDYKSGTQLHVDGTLAQHFPLFGGLAGVGVNGFWYEQVTRRQRLGRDLWRFRRAHGRTGSGALLRVQDRQPWT